MTYSLNDLTALKTETFLRNFRSGIVNFDSTVIPQTKLSKDNWQKLMELGVCLPAIPRKYGGRENHYEMCEIIENLSTYNLPLGMYVMIVTVLFLRNVSLSGSEEAKEEIFADFLANPVIGGLAFTEPNGGSNLSRMQTHYHKEEGNFHIVGTKHWQAFSEQADWWIVCAKHPKRKQFGYFIHKRSEGGFVTKEVYRSLGLNNLGYGLNELDFKVPTYRKLDKAREGLGDAAEILCASRFSKAAMSSGFLRRLTIEAANQAQNRRIGDSTLLDIEYVKYKVLRIKHNFIICHAIYRHLLLDEDYWHDVENSMFASLATKILTTEKMLESAIDYQQICGGEGYRFDCPTNMAAYALLDARVYTLFDGANDLLCQHLAGLFKREFATSGFNSVLDFIGQYRYTLTAIQHLTDINIHYLTCSDRQSQTVIFGRILSRIFGIHALQKMASCLEDSQSGEWLDSQSLMSVPFNISDIKKTVFIVKNELNCLIGEFDLSNSVLS